MLDYSRKIYAAFFRRELEIDQVSAIADAVASLGPSEQEFCDYFAAEGARHYREAQMEAASDEVFGAPAAPE